MIKTQQSLTSSHTGDALCLGNGLYCQTFGSVWCLLRLRKREPSSRTDVQHVGCNTYSLGSSEAHQRGERVHPQFAAPKQVSCVKTTSERTHTHSPSYAHWTLKSRPVTTSHGSSRCCRQLHRQSSAFQLSGPCGRLPETSGETGQTGGNRTPARKTRVQPLRRHTSFSRPVTPEQCGSCFTQWESGT